DHPPSNTRGKCRMTQAVPYGSCSHNRDMCTYLSSCGITPAVTRGADGRDACVLCKRRDRTNRRVERAVRRLLRLSTASGCHERTCRALTWLSMPIPHPREGYSKD